MNLRHYLSGIACLLGLLCAEQTAAQQTATQAPLVWYVPQSPFHAVSDQARGIVVYSSWTDLKQKLARKPGQPYHLRLQLDKQDAAEWQVLSQLPSPRQLHLTLLDSLPNEAVPSILAGWSELQTLELTADTGPRSITVVPDGKGGQQVIQNHQRLLSLPATGWATVRSIRELTLSGDMNVSEAVRVLSQLPSLETLTLQVWADGASAGSPPDLSKMTHLRTLNMGGFATQSTYVQALYQIPWLTSLALTSAEHAPLNDLFDHLPQLEKLWLEFIDAGPPLERLQLNKLPKLQSLKVKTSPRTATAVSIDSALAGVTGLQFLNLDGIRLASWPPNLTANGQLKVLSLVGCGLAQLPDDLSRLVELVELNLDRNPIRHVPESIGALKRLQQLSLNHCELELLPATIGQLTSLTNLSATQNSLKELPVALGQLGRLRELNISINDLTDLPPALGQVRTLERLGAFSNQISRFPTELNQVSYLYLSDNQLASLPPALGRMNRLRGLALAGNPLTTLPEEIGKLDSLEMLTLGNNRLTALPASIGNLRRLTNLDLGVNQLRVLPAEIGQLTSLTTIIIGNNPVEALPATVGNWRQLRTGTFQLPYLRQLPEQIGDWAQVEDLTIDSDQLVVVPDALTNCRNLLALTLIGNKLIGLPERIGDLSRLRQLTLSARADSATGNALGQLTILPASLARCTALTDLTIQQQRAFDGIEALQLASRMPQLQTLEMIRCGITDLNGINWGQLPLSKLSLIDNQLSRFPTEMLRMPWLTNLNLAGNNLPPAINRFFWSKADIEKALTKLAE